MRKTHCFQVEYAKSSMATCRVCMAKVPKGALRVGHSLKEVALLPNDITAPGAQFEEPTSPRSPEDRQAAAIANATRWHHFECFPNMKGAKWMRANLPRDVSDCDGFDELKKGDRVKMRRMWSSILDEPASSSSGAASSSRKRKGESGDDAGDKKRVRTESRRMRSELTSPQGVLTKKQYGKIQALEDQLSSSTSAQLQAELETNRQVKSGKKDELVRRVAEGRVLGALPKCPRCKYGRIHWSRVGGWHSCPGSYDSTLGTAKKCYFRAKEMTRLKWRRSSKK